MTALLILLVVVGLIASLIGSIMFLMAAFRESVGWGLAVLFIPFASLVFMVKFWDEVKQSVAISFGGGAVIIFAAFMVPDRDTTTPRAAVKEPARVERASEESSDSSPAVDPTVSSALLVRTEEPYHAAPPPAVTESVAPQHVDEEPTPILAQVYADSVTRTYYAADCATRPEYSFRIPKQIAERQGYTEATCR